MSKTWKILISVGCATCLLVSCIPESGIVLAAETGVEVQSEEVATSGTWGTCEWNLDEDGVLTISGGVGESTVYDGTMEEFYSPWEKVKDRIKKVEITGKISFGEEDITLGGLFGHCGNMTEIKGLEYLDTSRVRNMYGMFLGCSGLEELDVSGFDTSQVGNMWDMFSGCSGLKELDVSGFDTSQVGNMWSMFDGCSGLEELDVSGFDTSQVGCMICMFRNCSGLKELDVSGFDTSQVSFMGDMFYGCSGLEELDVSGFDTSQVSFMADMFYGCSGLEELDVSGFDTNRVQFMEFMFRGCSGVKELDVSGFDTSQVSNMGGMFDSCSGVKELNVSGFDTSQVEDMSFMFYGCSGLKELDVSGFDTSKVTDISGMFYGCSGLKELDVSGFDTSQAENMEHMFFNCSRLEELDVSGFDTSHVSNIGAMFYDCSGLKKLDVSGFDTSQAENMMYMFSGCSELKKLDVSGFDTSNVTDMNAMFSGCSGLKELDVSGFDTGKVESMIHMFYGCSGLEELDVSGFDTSQVSNMDSMFYGCRSLKELDVSGFNTSNVTNMEEMFSECSNLTKLNLRNFDIDNVEYISNIFYNNFLESVVMPERFKDENSRQVFVDYLMSEGLKLGKWKNVDTNEEYETLPDNMTDGQTYQYMGDVTISGSWGTSQWTLQSGEMTITGGMLDSLEKEDRPWSKYERDIKKIVFQGKIVFHEDTDFYYLFWQLHNVEDIQGLDYLDTSNINIISMYDMFRYCSSLQQLDLRGFDTSNVTEMQYMFWGCSSLQRLDLSGFDLSSVENMSYMFYECNNISRVVLPKNMGEHASDFITELQKGMKPGSWYDVTADIAYEGLPDTMQEGHEYINTAVYAVDKNTGISLKNSDGSVFDENLELITGDVSTDSNFSIYAEAADKLGKENLLYNIYLQKDGEVVQPDGQVQVSIPLPEGMRENAKVYYIAEDGTATDMNAEYMDGNLVFVTDHFSVYAVVNSSVLSGDIDGNGKVNLQDSALLRRYLAGWDVTIDENAADVDGNGKVNLQDSALLRRYLAGWDVTLK